MRYPSKDDDDGADAVFEWMEGILSEQEAKLAEPEKLRTSEIVLLLSVLATQIAELSAIELPPPEHRDDFDKRLAAAYGRYVEIMERFADEFDRRLPYYKEAERSWSN